MSSPHADALQVAAPLGPLSHILPASALAPCRSMLTALSTPFYVRERCLLGLLACAALFQCCHVACECMGAEWLALTLAAASG